MTRWNHYRKKGRQVTPRPPGRFWCGERVRDAATERLERERRRPDHPRCTCAPVGGTQSRPRLRLRRTAEATSYRDQAWPAPTPSAALTIGQFLHRCISLTKGHLSEGCVVDSPRLCLRTFVQTLTEPVSGTFPLPQAGYIRDSRSRLSESIHTTIP